jgi:predicted dehydrogenase
MHNPEFTRRSFLEKSLITSPGLGLATACLATTAHAQSRVKPVLLGESQKLRVAIFGCGNRSAKHIAAINHYSDRMEVAALCDILPEKLEEKRALVKFGGPRLYTDYEKMLKEGDDIHAIAIVLPNTLHKMGCVACLEAGKHVLCEKPLTLKLDETRAIIDASERTGRIVQVGTQSRHVPGYAVLAERLRDGLIGEVLYGWAQTFRSDWRKLYPDPAEDTRKNWRMKQSEGGSVVYEMGVHTIDVFNWFINSEPVEVTCLGGVHNERLQKRDSWDHAGLTVRYANGAVMTYGGNLYACGGAGPNVLFGDKSSLQIPERSARETTIFQRPYGRPFGESSGKVKEETIELPRANTDPSFLQYGHFLEAVQGKKPPFPSARDHLPAVLIARASELSQAEHRHIQASEVI